MGGIVARMAEIASEYSRLWGVGERELERHSVKALKLLVKKALGEQFLKNEVVRNTVRELAKIVSESVLDMIRELRDEAYAELLEKLSQICEEEGYEVSGPFCEEGDADVCCSKVVGVVVHVVRVYIRDGIKVDEEMKELNQIKNCEV